MGYYEPDPYAQPEKFGLTPIGMVDWYGDEACYEFSVTQVWKHEESGEFWWASDSGCSCYGPFENFRVEDGDIEKGTWSQAIAYLQKDVNERTRPEVQADVVDCIEAILRAR
jgi:hypothetical protein